MIRIFVLALLLFWPAIASAESAEEMRSACRTTAEAKVSEDRVNLSQTFSTGLCWGAFAALQKATRVVDTSRRPQVAFFGVCAPDESTRTQLISVFVEYVRVHPERLHEDFFFVAVSGHLKTRKSRPLSS